MSLSEKQRLFTQLIAKLIVWSHENDYELTFGDAYRDPRVFGKVGISKGYGHKSSAHKNRLAMDLNLFINGKYAKSSSDYKPLGEYWESLHELCRWGGHFADGNHFSLEHNGVK